MTDLLSAPDEAAALEALHAMGCTDGLPVVVPTPERVARMVLATGQPADLSLGAMGPALGDCTVEKVAAAAVMAGCTIDHAPVVLAAVKAVLDPTFDLTEMQATTHAITPLVIVNGPARSACGVHGGFGALGPGHRANATIGRALRLAMINIGGGRSGSSDMALLGHGGKFTMCLAENEEESPFAPLHTTRGFSADESTVTVIGTEAPHSIIAITDADDPNTVERLLASLAAGFANVTTNNAILGGGQAALALNPDHAAVLGAAGHDLASVSAAIVERAIVPATQMQASATGGLGKSRRCFENPDDLIVFVAGGTGLYSAAFASWCASPHKNRAVTVAIDLDPSCEVPWAT